MVVELDWDDIESLRRDFASPLGQATAPDVDELAKLCPGIQSLTYKIDAL
jgi:hypothetical protein